MNVIVETGAEAAQFPGKEYINGIAIEVRIKYKNPYWTYITVPRK
jgi:hypothetical protein